MALLKVKSCGGVVMPIQSGNFSLACSVIDRKADHTMSTSLSAVLRSVLLDDSDIETDL
jgi:hypothetical protein